MNDYLKLFGIIITLFLFSLPLVKGDDNSDCDGCSGKCGTHLTLTNDGKEYLQRTYFLDSNEIPTVGQKSTISPLNIFKIHYDTIGVHAPTPADKNQNGIPDYVDSVCYYFDYVYQKYTNELGFRSPYPDRGARGSDHYDIYLYDLGNSDDDTVSKYSAGGLYGLTTSATYDAISADPFLVTYSFIMIDNDFAATDSIRNKGSNPSPAFKFPGIPSLKVTIAHEFFHAIQFMYGQSQPASSTVMEMNAVAMERVFFPEVLDYLQYVRRLFRNPSSLPFGIDDPYSGYGHSIFNQYLIENFGIEIMRLIWDKVALGHEVYSAIDLALKDLGSSLPSAWCEFLDWAYYTGERTIEGTYFSNAAELPLIEPFSIIYYESPSKSTSGYMAPYEFRMVRFYFQANGNLTDNNLDILLGNLDIKSASSQFNITKSYYISTSDEETQGSTKIPDLNYWVYYEYDSTFFCHHSHSNPGYEIAHAYPNPFKVGKDEVMLIPAPLKTEIYQKILLVIYDSEMQQIYSKSLPVTVNNHNKTVRWDDMPKDISSGIYIFGIHNGDEVVLGKFAIINN